VLYAACNTANGKEFAPLMPAPLSVARTEEGEDEVTWVELDPLIAVLLLAFKVDTGTMC
jgi:hypothetical protein